MALALLGADKANPQQSNQAQPQQQQAPAPAPPPRDAKQPLWNDDACYKAKDHNAADLCAQWRAAVAAEEAAKAAKRAVTWTIVGTFLSGLALGALLWTLHQTEKALDQARLGNSITESGLHRQLRPYVYLTNVHMTFPHPIMDGASPSDDAPVVLYFKNFGQTPAKHVTLRAKAIIGGIWNEPFDVNFDDCALVHLGDMPPDFPKDRDGYTVLGTREAYPNILFGVASVFVCGVIEYDDGIPGKKPYRSEFRLVSSADDFKNEKFSPTPRGNESD